MREIGTTITTPTTNSTPILRQTMGLPHIVLQPQLNQNHHLQILTLLEHDPVVSHVQDPKQPKAENYGMRDSSSGRHPLIPPFQRTNT
jgi:hypothetical protein